MALNHRRVAARTEAFDFDHREQAILAGFTETASGNLFRRFAQIVRTTQPARCRAAQLDEVLADRFEVEHGVEGCDLEHADFRHVKIVGDMLDCRGRQPAGIG